MFLLLVFSVHLLRISSSIPTVSIKPLSRAPLSVLTSSLTVSTGLAAGHSQVVTPGGRFHWSDLSLLCDRLSSSTTFSVTSFVLLFFVPSHLPSPFVLAELHLFIPSLTETSARSRSGLKAPLFKLLKSRSIVVLEQARRTFIFNLQPPTLQSLYSLRCEFSYSAQKAVNTCTTCSKVQPSYCFLLRSRLYTCSNRRTSHVDTFAFLMSNSQPVSLQPLNTGPTVAHASISFALNFGSSFPLEAQLLQSSHNLGVVPFRSVIMRLQSFVTMSCFAMASLSERRHSRDTLQWLNLNALNHRNKWFAFSRFDESGGSLIIGTTSTKPNSLSFNMGPYSPLCFEKSWGLVVEIKLSGWAVWPLFSNYLRGLVHAFGYETYFPPSRNLISIRERWFTFGLVHRPFYPGWDLSVHRLHSRFERFQTAIKRVFNGLKAALYWSTSEKCENLWFKHLDPIEDNLDDYY